jgi:hypothetical protein
LNNGNSSRLKALQPTMIVCTDQFSYRDMGREANQDDFFYDVNDADAGFKDSDDGHQNELDLKYVAKFGDDNKNLDIIH